METLGQIVGLLNDATNAFVVFIIFLTIAMSFFLYKILFEQGYFSDYNRNL